VRPDQGSIDRGRRLGIAPADSASPVVLPVELRGSIDAGALAHPTTINADGSPQVTVIWIGRDGDELLSAHLDHRLKLRKT
jgi:hypothetical protein